MTTEKKEKERKIAWYKKNTNKSPECPHYINSNPKYNPDGWEWCTQCTNKTK